MVGLHVLFDLALGHVGVVAVAAAERFQPAVMPHVVEQLVPAWVSLVAPKADILLAGLVVKSDVSPVHLLVIKVFATEMNKVFDTL